MIYLSDADNIFLSRYVQFNEKSITAPFKTFYGKFLDIGELDIINHFSIEQLIHPVPNSGDHQSQPHKDHIEPHHLP